MFQNKVTIINGERSSGKTTLLIKIIETLIQLNIRVYFLDVFEESSYLKKLYTQIGYDRLSTSKNNIDYQISRLRNIIETEKIEFLIIDDSDNIDSKLIEKLINIDCKIILTRSIISGDKSIFQKIIDKLFKKSCDCKNITVKSLYFDSSLRVSNVVQIDDEEYTFEEIKPLIFSKFREKKINYILEGK